MKYAHPPMNPTPKPHDPRIAPLAAAMEAAGVASDMFNAESDAAAILGPRGVFLPDGLPEGLTFAGEGADRIAVLPASATIARLRAIEEAARAVIVARDAWLACDDDWEDDCGHNHDVAFDALRAALGEKP